MNFSRRSNQKELLDREDIPFEDIRRNMEELEFINKHLGGHRISISGLKKLLDRRVGQPRPVVIAEIGCGGGDNLKAIQNWCQKKNLACSVIGIDINANCIEVAKKKLQASNALLIAADYKSVDFETEKPDIIFSSLFCHHFTDEQLCHMLHWMNKQSTTGFFINDLHRHPLAYFSIKVLTGLFSRSYLVKNDAPVSVLRGFARSDWKELLSKAGIMNYQLHWRWAFRYLLVVPATGTL